MKDSSYQPIQLMLFMIFVAASEITGFWQIVAAALLFIGTSDIYRWVLLWKEK